MIGHCLKALAGHWRRRPAQALVLILGLAVATALWTGVQAINAEARKSYQRAESILAGDRLSQIIRQDAQALTEKDFARLRRGGWLVSPVLEGSFRQEGKRHRLLGVDVLTLPPAAALTGEGGPQSLNGFLTPPYETLISPNTAATLDPAGLPPLRAITALPDGTLMVPIGIAQQLLRKPGAVSRLLLAETQKPARAPLATLGPYQIRPPSAQTELGTLTDSFHLNLTAFGLLSFVVGLFIVHGTIGLAFEQRRAVIRTMRALGAPLRVMITALLIEVVLASLVAGIIGVALGYAIAQMLLPGVATSLDGLYDATVSSRLSLSPRWWFGGLAMALVGALAAASTHLVAIARMEVLTIAQHQAWLGATEARQRGQLRIALVAALIGLAAAVWGTGLLSGFAVMGGALVAAALCLPSLVTIFLKFAARRASSAKAHWFWADSEVQMNGLSLALMALLLALAINIGVGTMVGGFRLTFLAWLDQRLAADIYVRANDRDTRDLINQTLAARDEVKTVLAVESTDITLANWPIGVTAIADDPYYPANWALLEFDPGSWASLAAADGVMVSEQTARKLSRDLGDVIDIFGWRPKIVGIYADYGNTKGAMLVGRDAMTHLPAPTGFGGAALLTEGDAGQVITAVEDSLSLPQGNLIDQHALKGQARRIFEDTFRITTALNALTLAIAGLAMTTALLTLAQIRLPQLAPVWAMGMTRAEISRLELARAAMLALLTALMAIPLGILFAWILTAIINVEAFGWRLPLYYFPSQWVALTVLALLTAILASLWPAIRLRQTPAAQLVRVFCDER